MSEIRKSKNSTLKEATEIMKMVHKLLPSYIPLITLQTLIAAMLPFISVLYGSKIIDGIITKKSKATLIFYVIAMILISLLLGLVHFALDKKRLVNEQYIEKINKAMLGEKSLSIDYEILEKKETLELLKKAADGSNSSGGLTQLCTNVVELLQQIFSIIYSIVLSIGLFTSVSSTKKGSLFGFMNSPISSAALYVFLIAAIILSTLVIKQYSKMKYNFYENNVDSNRKFGYFFDFMYNYSIGKDIRIYGLDKFLNKKMMTIFSELKKSYTKLFKRSLKFEYYIILLNSLWEYTAYIFVGIKAALGIISIGKLTLYVGVLKLLNTSITTLFSKYIDLSVKCSYIKNYTSFLSIKSEKYMGTLPVEKRLDNEYELEFKNVSFHYPNSEEMIIKNISLKLMVGSKLAIVGRNGAGKTTFIKLLCRLYDPTEGEILLNGINIKKYDYNEYLNLFSVVFQDFKLFSFSVAENVATSQEYVEADILKCLELSGTRIEKFPEGINTNIYNNQEKGIEISGGEAQKLSIARALYKNSPIVILDEPTSALDPISEFEIYERFNGLVKEKTSIFISHRMSSCRMCDNILVFDKGHIVQIGNHEKLINDKEGIYYSLWQAQAKYYI